MKIPVLNHVGTPMLPCLPAVYIPCNGKSALSAVLMHPLMVCQCLLQANCLQIQLLFNGMVSRSRNPLATEYTLNRP